VSGPTRRAGPRTSAHVAQDLAAAQQVLAAREADVRDAASAYEASLDLGREAALDARQRLNEAEVDRDVARRAAEKLEVEHDLAVEGERRAVLAGIIAEADAKIAAYRETVERLLPGMGQAARKIMREWAEAELANEAAERAMQASLKAEGVQSAGRCRLSVEAFRAWPGRPREVVGEPRDFELWTNARGEPPGDEWQAKIKLQADGTGVLQDGGRNVFTHRRRYREENVIPAQPGKGIELLVKKLFVPGVTAADQPGWSPPSNLSPSKVLAHLDELERPLDIAEDRRWAKLETNPVGPAYEIEHQPSPWRRDYRGPFSVGPESPLPV